MSLGHRDFAFPSSPNRRSGDDVWVDRERRRAETPVLKAGRMGPTAIYETSIRHRNKGIQLYVSAMNIGKWRN